MKIKKSITTITGGLLIALLAIMLSSGCANIFLSRHVIVNVKQDSTNVAFEPLTFYKYSALSHSITMYDYSTGNNIDKVSEHGFVKAKMNNRSDGYMIIQEKKNYLPMTTFVYKTKFNTMKAIDFALPVLGMTYILADSNSRSNNPPVTDVLLYPALFFSTAGWFLLIGGPTTMFDKSYNLPALMPIPQEPANANKIFLKDISLNFTSIDTVNFRSYKDYMKNKQSAPVKASISGKPFSKFDFNQALRKVLTSWKYSDSATKTYTSISNSSYYLKGSVSHLSYFHCSTISYYNVECSWSMYETKSNKMVYSATYTDLSKPDYFVSMMDGPDNLCDGIVRTLSEFLRTSNVATLLTDTLNTLVTPVKSDDWYNLPIHIAATDSVHRLNDALSAVVTIKTPEGHGSGCIISSDGYIITNYHVIAEDTSDNVNIIMQNGDTNSALYIRGNENYDLALLKLTHHGALKCLLADTSGKAPLGDEVFAIGTPKNIALGQTLTKGIISGFRKIKDKEAIQTDCSISPGNSGGALVSTNGRLLGIVNAKIVGEAVEGLGFAIPAHYIYTVLKLTKN